MEKFSYDWLELAVYPQHRPVVTDVLVESYLQAKALLQKHIPKQLQLAQCYVAAAPCFSALDERKSDLSDHVYEVLQVSCAHSAIIFINELLQPLAVPTAVCLHVQCEVVTLSVLVCSSLYAYTSILLL
jgi:hypothetical protein